MTTSTLKLREPSADGSSYTTYWGYKIAVTRLRLATVGCVCGCREPVRYGVSPQLADTEIIESVLSRHYTGGRHRISPQQLGLLLERVRKSPRGASEIRVGEPVFVVSTRCTRGCEERIEVISPTFDALAEHMVDAIEDHLRKKDEDKLRIMEPSPGRTTRAQFRGYTVTARLSENADRYDMLAACPHCPQSARVVIVMRGVSWRDCVIDFRSGIRDHDRANHA